MEHFLAGQLACLRELTPVLRAQHQLVQALSCPGRFAPPRCAWGVDNRTCALRVVGHGPSLRIETPGARRRREPVPRGRCAHRRRTARHRARAAARAARAPATRTRATARAVPSTLRDARRAVRAERDRRATRSATTSSTTTPTWPRVELAAFDAAVTDWERYPWVRAPVTNQARRQGRRHHRRRKRHRARQRRAGFAADGARVVIADVDEAAGTRRGGRGRRRCSSRVDVTIRGRGRAHVRGRRRAHSAASTSRSTTPASRRPTTTRSSTTDLDVWRRVQDVNLTSVYLCCKAVHPAHAASGQAARSSTPRRSWPRWARRRRRSPTPRRRAACSRCHASSACSSHARASA